MEIVDRIPVAKLEERYSVVRSVLYDRIKALNIKPQKIGNKSYLNAEQLQQLDDLDVHMKTGGSLAMFIDQVKPSAEQTGGLSVISPDSSQLLLNVIAAMANQQTLDPLADYELLERIASANFYLPTKRLLRLLQLKTIPKLDDHKRFSRMGFVFWQVGRVGRESEWKVTKL